MKVLSFDQSRCTRCGACQTLCSLRSQGQIRPSQARIRLRSDHAMDTVRAAVCQHCAEPVCVSACMRGIISKDRESGLVSRKTEDCFRCAACSVMCPVGAVVLDEEMEAFVSCDLCGGEPLCAEICPQGAIRYEEVERSIEQLRMQYARRAMEEGEEER